MVHCIYGVFASIPPERDDIPDKKDIYDATINIQAFLLNAFWRLYSQQHHILGC